MPTVSQKGQVTIPISIREALGIHSGDEIQFEETDTGYVIRKQPNDDGFEKWYGAISTNQTMRERMEELRDRPLSDQSETDGTDHEEEESGSMTDVAPPTNGSD